jgi:hypothetical protein
MRSAFARMTLMPSASRTSLRRSCSSSTSAR